MDRAASRPRAGTSGAGAAALVPMLLLLLPACGGDDGRIPLYPAAGLVLIDGQPAEGIQITLHPPDKAGDLDALRPRGKTGADGSFKLGTYEKKDGAPAGRYVATMFWPDAPPGMQPPNDLLKGKYCVAADSTFEVTIEEGPTQIEPFHLTLTKSTSRPASPRR